MALGLTPTIAICLAAGVAAGVGLARPGDDESTADTRYESVEPAGGGDAGDPVPGYGGPAETAAPAGGGDEPAVAPTAAIVIADFAFAGDTNVAPGTEIVVTNQDGAAHTLTSRDDRFNTGQLDGDASATIVAPGEPGSYDFFCTIHPSMQGTLVVG